MSGRPHQWPALFLWVLSLRLTLIVAVQTIVRNLDQPHGLALDRREGRIYWTEVGRRQIASARLDGSEAGSAFNASASGEEEPSGVAVDAAAQKVYWTTRCCAVRRANLDGSDVEVLAATQYGGGIALDPSAGKMYWTSWNGTIWRANLNGSEVQPLVSSSSSAPMNLALDTIRRHLYWTDNGKQTVNRANLDTGLDRRVLNVSYFLEQSNGIAFDLARGRLYVAGSLVQSGNLSARRGTGAIYRALLESEENDLIVGGHALQVPYGIVYDSNLGSVIWTDEKAGTIQRLDMRCAPGSLYIPSRTNASHAEVTYGPMMHGGLLESDCPSGYTGRIGLVCYDGKVSVSSGQCSRQCPAGRFTGSNGTNLTHGELMDGDTIAAPCNDGLVGPVTLVCQDGTMAVESGRCQVPEDCPAGVKSLLESAMIRHDPMAHGTHMKYDCPRGFNGSYVLGCRNGVVYPVTGMCRASCEQGSLWVDQGDGPIEVSHPEILPGQKLNVFCPEGFAGNGVKLQCVSDFITVLSAQCIKTKRCPAGRELVNGASLAHVELKEGASLSARCPDGFSGVVNFTCTNGALEKRGGNCHRDCGAASIMDSNNVTVKHNGTHHGNFVFAMCPAGYGGVLPLRCSDGLLAVNCVDLDAARCTCQPLAPAQPRRKDSVEVPMKMLLPIVLVAILSTAAACLFRYSQRCRKARRCSMPSSMTSITTTSTLTTPSSASTLSAAALGRKPRGGSAGTGYLPERDDDMIADEAGAGGTPMDGNEDFSQSVVPLPSYWATMDGIHITPDPNRINEVQQLMSETWRVCYTRDRMMVGGGSRVPVGCRVANVLRIENHRGYEKYFHHRDRIAALRRGTLEPFETTTDRRLNLLDESSGEKYLFHGTNPESAHNIARKLFRIDMAGSSRGCMFGPGIYLAENASKSDEYAKEGSGVYMGLAAMLICRAVTGKVNRVESSGDFSDSVLSGEHDCVCGDRLAAAGTFREMVFFHEEAVYPEFIVIYARVYDS